MKYIEDNIKQIPPSNLPGLGSLGSGAHKPYMCVHYIVSSMYSMKSEWMLSHSQGILMDSVKQYTKTA